MTVNLEGRTIDVRAASLPTAWREADPAFVGPDQPADYPGTTGFPGHLEKYINIMCRPYGFILVTGPTGSGKSTTCMPPWRL